jgi:hypothetical protein
LTFITTSSPAFEDHLKRPPSHLICLALTWGLLYRIRNNIYNQRIARLGACLKDKDGYEDAKN